MAEESRAKGSLGFPHLNSGQGEPPSLSPLGSQEGSTRGSPSLSLLSFTPEEDGGNLMLMGQPRPAPSLTCPWAISSPCPRAQPVQTQSPLHPLLGLSGVGAPCM